VFSDESNERRNEDVTKTMYRDTIRKSDTVTPSQPIEASESENKVNIICNAFLEVLKCRSNDYLQNIITAYVCKYPPDLVGGLHIISQLKGVLLRCLMLMKANTV
jgi:elongator complex protein 1